MSDDDPEGLWEHRTYRLVPRVLAELQGTLPELPEGPLGFRCKECQRLLGAGQPFVSVRPDVTSPGFIGPDMTITTVLCVYCDELPA